jgi:hypothetical protein
MLSEEEWMSLAMEASEVGRRARQRDFPLGEAFAEEILLGVLRRERFPRPPGNVFAALDARDAIFGGSLLGTGVGSTGLEAGDVLAGWWRRGS